MPRHPLKYNNSELLSRSTAQPPSPVAEFKRALSTAESHAVAVKVPYMKLKRWLLNEGSIPAEEIKKAAGRPSLIVLMQRYGVHYSGAGHI